MEYKKQEIGTPTVEMFEEYIERQCYALTGKEVYDYCKKRNWMTRRGTPMKSVEIMTDCYNGIMNKYTDRGMFDSDGKLRHGLTKAYLAKLLRNIDTFVSECSPDDKKANAEAIDGIRRLVNEYLERAKTGTA